MNARKKSNAASSERPVLAERSGRALVLLTEVGRTMPTEFFIEGVLGGTLSVTALAFFYIDRSEAGGTLEDDEIA